MAAGSALLQRRVCGVPRVFETGGWQKERAVREDLKLGLSWRGSLRCRGRRAIVVVVSASSKTRAVAEEMQAECAVAEPQNGVYALPAVPSVSSSDHIGYGLLDESNFYRERFVVRFSEVGDRGTMSLEMLASLLQVFF